MDISAQKLELIEWLIKLQDQALIDNLSSIKDMLSAPTAKWDDLSSAERQSILNGMEDAKSGRVIAHEEVIKKYGKYL